MSAPENIETAIKMMRAHSEPGRAEGMATYHKATRIYLGVPNPALNDLTRDWRLDMTLDQRVTLASALWESDIHEARIAAGKLLTQARIKPDDQVWALLQSWVPQFDAWAVADHASSAIARRLHADPTRLSEVELWTKSDHMWTRRAALVSTLWLTKLTHPSERDLQARDRVLGWAASYVPDQQWFIQKSIAWWLRDLSKHDPDRVVAFLKAHGEGMRSFARKEARRYLSE